MIDLGVVVVQWLSLSLQVFFDLSTQKGKTSPPRIYGILGFLKDREGEHKKGGGGWLVGYNLQCMVNTNLKRRQRLKAKDVKHPFTN